MGGRERCLSRILLWCVANFTELHVPKCVTGGPRLGGLRGRLGECWEVARSQHGGTLRGGVHAGGFPFRVYQGRVLIRRATV